MMEVIKVSIKIRTSYSKRPFRKYRVHWELLQINKTHVNFIYDI